jgi:hypothetical protein
MGGVGWVEADLVSMKSLVEHFWWEILYRLFSFHSFYFLLFLYSLLCLLQFFEWWERSVWWLRNAEDVVPK